MLRSIDKSGQAETVRRIAARYYFFISVPWNSISGFRSSSSDSSSSYKNVSKAVKTHRSPNLAQFK
jgi:hypothetical protein